MSDAFGAAPARASVSFVGVEPIEVLRFSGPDSVWLVTLGMSRRVMGDNGAGIDQDGLRAELVVQLHGDGGDLWRRLAVLAAAPVVEGVIYLAGMTVDLMMTLDASSICTGGVIGPAELAPIATTAGEVRLLRFVPATATELAFSRVHGAAALQERWGQAGTDLLDLSRPAVALG